jgi:hypothetical protein
MFDGDHSIEQVAEEPELNAHRCRDETQALPKPIAISRRSERRSRSDAENDAAK